MLYNGERDTTLFKESLWLDSRVNKASKVDVIALFKQQKQRRIIKSHLPFFIHPFQNKYVHFFKFFFWQKKKEMYSILIKDNENKKSLITKALAHYSISLDACEDQIYFEPHRGALFCSVFYQRGQPLQSKNCN